ncbi:MAG: hypothetical protein JXR36_09500 [Bacteroidales bacterium]|nr:hypothetical protein [Bacteroidales bacterium]
MEKRFVRYKSFANSIERKGLFHQWGIKVFEAPNGTHVPETYAIIEDIETGEIKTVFPINEGASIIFEK